MRLDPQRLLFIGTAAEAIPVPKSKFFDAFNVMDFQLVAWNAETFITEIQEKTGLSFQSYHHPFAHQRFKALYEERIIQILDWVRYGHVLVIFPYLFSSEMKTDGPNGPANVDINGFPPFNLINLRHVPEGSLSAQDRSDTRRAK